MEKNNYIENMINRYVYQVTKHLPVQSRQDIEKELRSIIYDMLEEKTLDKTASPNDIEEVLTELGDPSDMADKYRDKTRCLISSTLYPHYIVVLKIVLAATMLAMSIVTVLELLTEHLTPWHTYFVNLFVNLFTNIVSSGFYAFAWVTIIFAFIEWRGVNLRKIMPEWNVSSLPPVPDNNNSISIWDPILSLIFTVLSTFLLVSAPELLGGYFYSDRLNVIPVFDLVILEKVLPLFIICFSLGIITEIFTMLERRYTIKLAILNLTSSLIQIVILIVIFTKFPIWNQNFISDLNNQIDIVLGLPVGTLWNMLTNNFIVIVILIYLIESITTVYKTIKYNKLV